MRNHFWSYVSANEQKTYNADDYEPTKTIKTHQPEIHPLRGWCEFLVGWYADAFWHLNA